MLYTPQRQGLKLVFVCVSACVYVYKKLNKHYKTVNTILVAGKWL